MHHLEIFYIENFCEENMHTPNILQNVRVDWLEMNYVLDIKLLSIFNSSFFLYKL